MRRLTVAGTTIAVLSATAAVAQAGVPTTQHKQEYKHAYSIVVKKFGKRAPGRDILRDGVSSGRPATDQEIVRSLAVLHRMLAPAPVIQKVVYTAPVQTLAPVTPAVTSSPAPVSSSTAGASGVPACASESGTNYSTGPANTNPSSGATGRYQITPGTAANYNCNLSTPSGQDACAQVIYANQGTGAWVGCGG